MSIRNSVCKILTFGFGDQNEENPPLKKGARASPDGYREGFF
jgi:hypothetical protein